MLYLAGFFFCFLIITLYQIPFRDFVLTSHGYVQKRQLEMNRAQVKTVGFSIVRQDGDFSLELDWIKALNTPDTFGDQDMVVMGGNPATGRS